MLTEQEKTNLTNTIDEGFKMNLINYDPFKTMSRLQDEINTLFRSSDFSPTQQLDNVNQWVPSVDLKEEKKQFVIKADIPGVDPKDIDVSMQDNVLTIKGERKTEEHYEKNDYHRIECSYGFFLSSL